MKKYQLTVYHMVNGVVYDLFFHRCDHIVINLSEPLTTHYVKNYSL